ncbi:MULTISPECIES: hypothetical protein [Burkholderia]|uniref:Uncharacterized protein n=1 Tax=Burkholderia contaminans TaxID=488447 RepID=A0A2S5E4F1_9BURK|nr:MULTISPECIES: hypothetical protein [Burkholderia]EKS9795899.1 hypothetical protein [Burkholderia cepacia]EKS9806679.1 hypothetical protein [Burkholderia cepacia]EKS9814148.1 hypothetical protein [Burkholderia cepacia]EKS9819223.1 hypothetical protein [Burkholderia cepacia]EKS9827025.1 hypothetical protein [Burkholderia cepacia]
MLITPGLHPELVEQRAGELPQLLKQIEKAMAIGEVGMDGSYRFKSSLSSHGEDVCGLNRLSLTNGEGCPASTLDSSSDLALSRHRVVFGSALAAMEVSDFGHRT